MLDETHLKEVLNNGFNVIEGLFLLSMIKVGGFGLTVGYHDEISTCRLISILRLLYYISEYEQLSTIFAYSFNSKLQFGYFIQIYE